MSEHADIRDIRAALAKRRDVFLYPKTEGDGVAPIIGHQLRRSSESYVKGADTYHPFAYKGWLYYGQAFAIDRVTRGKMTEAQQEWREGFEVSGGVYIVAKDMRDVLTALAPEPEDVQDYIARAPMRRF